MINPKLKSTMLSDARLDVPMYQQLHFWLEQDCQPLIDLVNDTDDISSLLFNPLGALIQQRLAFNPALHSHEEIQFLVNTTRDFYRPSPAEQIAMNLSDTEYAPAAYSMDACLLEWLLQQSLSSLTTPNPLTPRHS